MIANANTQSLKLVCFLTHGVCSSPHGAFRIPHGACVISHCSCNIPHSSCVNNHCHLNSAHSDFNFPHAPFRAYASSLDKWHIHFYSKLYRLKTCMAHSMLRHTSTMLVQWRHAIAQNNVSIVKMRRLKEWSNHSAVKFPHQRSIIMVILKNHILQVSFSTVISNECHIIIMS